MVTTERERKPTDFVEHEDRLFYWIIKKNQENQSM